MIPKIEKGKCVDCGACVDACPGQVFILNSEGVRVAYPEECIECRACEEACPAEAVHLAEG